MGALKAEREAQVGPAGLMCFEYTVGSPMVPLCSRRSWRRRWAAVLSLLPPSLLHLFLLPSLPPLPRLHPACSECEACLVPCCLQVAALLGPKTEADLVKPDKKKKPAKPAAAPAGTSGMFTVAFVGVVDSSWL